MRISPAELLTDIAWLRPCDRWEAEANVTMNYIDTLANREDLRRLEALARP